MTRVRAALALAALLLVGGAAARHQLAPVLTVDYYFIPHCLACAQVRASLDSIPQEFGRRVRLRTIDCYSDEGRAAAEKYGFVTHGVVAHHAVRGLIFEQKDHGVSGEDVKVVLRETLAGRSF